MAEKLTSTEPAGRLTTGKKLTPTTPAGAFQGASGKMTETDPAGDRDDTNSHDYSGKREPAGGSD